MPRKQATPYQSNQPEEIKRKARISQEARLQRTINRLHRQESSSGAVDIITTEPYRLDPLRTSVKYYRSYEVVEPKRQQLAEANTKLDQANTQLSSVRAHVPDEGGNPLMRGAIR